MYSLKVRKFLKKIKDDFGILPKDLHITRKACALVAISDGKVIKMEKPEVHRCPLFTTLFRYDELNEKNIEKKFDWQCRQWGMFTCTRKVCDENIMVPFGASEMIMYALRKKNIDAAVTVCDGAGTVITSNPGIVQGIGAYMNGLFYTTPIPEVISNIQKDGSIVLLPADAEMDQFKGVNSALDRGFKKIAVTVRGDEKEALKKIRELEKKECLKNEDVKIIILAICNTGITASQSEVIKKNADLAWACASKYLRDIVGPASILQVGMKIPVFVLTGNGLDFITSYSDDASLKNKLRDLKNKHYITSGKFKEGAIKIKMGKFYVYLYETKFLPLAASDEPEPLI